MGVISAMGQIEVQIGGVDMEERRIVAVCKITPEGLRCRRTHKPPAELLGQESAYGQEVGTMERRRNDRDPN